MLLQHFAVIREMKEGQAHAGTVKKVSGEGQPGHFVKALCSAVGKVDILSQEEPFAERWPQQPHRGSQGRGGVGRENVQ